MSIGSGGSGDFVPSHFRSPHMYIKRTPGTDSHGNASNTPAKEPEISNGL